jgi:hypothetical protein
MNCQQFQEVLPHIIESGGNQEQEAHLQSCKACSELVRDLKYIAEQAKLLLPMRDPSPRVWTNIQQSLEREGLGQEGRMSRLGHTTAIPIKKKSWTPLGVALAATAVLALAVLLINYHPIAPASQATDAAAQNSTTIAFDSNDQLLISHLSQQNPDVGKAYETGLREINSYISDSQQAVRNDPANAAARKHLAHAYQQKAMLYQMATSRSLQ